MIETAIDAFWYENLTNEQQKAFNDLEERLTSKGVLCAGLDDRISILRFLKARQFNPERAERMYVDMVRWRKEQQVDELWAKRGKAVSDKHKDMIKQCYTTFYHKTDRFGRPVYYELTGKSNPQKLCDGMTLEQFLAYHILQCEHFRRVKLPGCTRAAGHEIVQSVIIIDLEGLSYKHFTTQVRTSLSAVAKMDQDFFPEHLGAMYVINAPFVFRSIWACIKPLLDERTVKKIHMLGADYTDTLLKVIPADNLPTFFGGKSVCDVMRDEGPWLDDSRRSSLKVDEQCKEVAVATVDLQVDCRLSE